ncbi:hypothetical protein PVAP13_8KG084368 [Panicum virgatum]|uniref:Uncharacterized protein n=1 Tax=Panicum virgatum TaxID=38727 RepID=A0A8T0PI37_PANVG|nr:hypothetical protein PVAP13_8KG084368 [Panicum virgatum]
MRGARESGRGPLGAHPRSQSTGHGADRRGLAMRLRLPRHVAQESQGCRRAPQKARWPHSRRLVDRVAWSCSCAVGAAWRAGMAALASSSWCPEAAVAPSGPREGAMWPHSPPGGRVCPGAAAARCQGCAEAGRVAALATWSCCPGLGAVAAPSWPCSPPEGSRGVAHMRRRQLFKKADGVDHPYGLGHLAEWMDWIGFFFQSKLD